MPDHVTLHPLDADIVARYVAAVVRSATAAGALVPHDPAWAEHLIAGARASYATVRGSEAAGVNAVSVGLAKVLATAHPTYLGAGIGLSLWEARTDRGLGMLLRPPSRLFGEAGVAMGVARAMPIRLDPSRGQMGGSHIPARLIPELRLLLDARTDRLLRRLADAELDPVPTLGLLMEAVAYAERHGMGLYEASGVVDPRAPAAAPPGTRALVPDRTRLDPALRTRLEEAARPPAKPGLLSRLSPRRARRL